MQIAVFQMPEGFYSKFPVHLAKTAIENSGRTNLRNHAKHFAVDAA